MIALQRLTFVSGLLALAACALPACYVETEPPPPVVTSADVSVGYEPAYYDGYVVYYDTVGHPYYYDRGAVVYVSPGSPHYVGLVNHYHVYGRGYGHWYAHDGYRYHEYRRAPAYHSYHGYDHGHDRGRRR